jgi:hypothetical protein
LEVVLPPLHHQFVHWQVVLELLHLTLPLSHFRPFPATCLPKTCFSIIPFLHLGLQAGSYWMFPYQNSVCSSYFPLSVWHMWHFPLVKHQVFIAS